MLFWKKNKIDKRFLGAKKAVIPKPAQKTIPFQEAYENGLFLNYDRSYSLAMVKGHCKAYRLRTSPNYTNPCEWNRNVYAEILHLYTDVNTTKKTKLFGRR